MAAGILTHFAKHIDSYRGKEFLCLESGGIFRSDLTNISINNSQIEVDAYWKDSEEVFQATLFDGKNWAKIIE